MARLIGYFGGVGSTESRLEGYSRAKKCLFEQASRATVPVEGGEWHSLGDLAAIYHVSSAYSPVSQKFERDVLVFIEGGLVGHSRDSACRSLHEAYLCGNLRTFLQEAEGAFFGGVLDLEKKKVTLFRDRFGSKPFFYSVKGSTLYFGSSPGSLALTLDSKRRENKSMIARFAAAHYQHIYSEDETFFEGVRQLPGASLLTWSSDRHEPPKVAKYWEPEANAPFFEGRTEERMADEVRELLTSSIRRRLMPLESFAFSLSGGMDSTTLLCFYSKLTGKHPTAVSVTYHEDVRANEAALIRPTVDAYVSKWINVQPTGDELFDELTGLYDFHDQPWPTATLYAQDRMLRATAEAGIPTLVSGSGGDHHMAGDYPNFLHYFATLKFTGQTELLKHEVAKWIEYHSEYPWIKTPETVETFFEQFIDFSENGKIKSGPVELYSKKSVLAPGYREHLKISPPVRSFGDYVRTFVVKEITRAAYPPALYNEDCMGWQYGISEHAPYWDKALFEYCWKIPHAMKIRDGISKHLMRKVTEGAVLDHIRLRKAKTGFNLPFDVWARHGKLSEMVEEIIHSRELAGRGVVDAGTAKELFSEHKAGTASHGMSLWQIVNLELWFRKWIDGGNQ